jgi:putative thiamine transport system permease protein
MNVKLYNQFLKVILILFGIVILGPTFFGFLGLLFPAFGYFPSLGSNDFSIKYFYDLFLIPGILKSILLSFSTGFFSTILALLFSQIILLCIFNTRVYYYLKIIISPLLAMPHITMAVGLIFLLSPSGLFFRLLSPWLTGFHRPPDFFIIPDEYGLSLILGLTLKEIPFFLLASMAAIEQFPANNIFKIGKSLQHSNFSTWWLLIFPNLYKRIRLVIFIVIAFTSSVIDMAVLLAPSTPSTLSIRILQIYQSVDLDSIFIASSLALLQVFVILILILFWFLLEKIINQKFFFLFLIKTLPRKKSFIEKCLFTIGVFLILLSIVGIVNALFWGLGDQWYFPNIFPDNYTFDHLVTFLHENKSIMFISLFIALIVSLTSIITIVVWLELCDYLSFQNRYLESLIFIPLFIPQISFLIGVQTFLIKIGFQSYLIALIAIEILYVIPYCFILLGPALRGVDKDFISIGASLGKNRVERLFFIKIPLITSSLLTSFGIGIIISLSLYTPVYFIGAGRVTTLTVETLNLAISGSRQDLGVATVFQIIIPILILLIIVYVNKKLTKWSF